MSLAAKRSRHPVVHSSLPARRHSLRFVPRPPRGLLPQNIFCPPPPPAQPSTKGAGIKKEKISRNMSSYKILASGNEIPFSLGDGREDAVESKIKTQNAPFSPLLSLSP